KVQGDNPNVSKGAIEVRYYPSRRQIRIQTREPHRPWQTIVTLPATFSNGDRLSARAGDDGLVQVYRNETLIGEARAGSFFFHRGGSIGLRYLDANGAMFDDFGGGTAR